MNFFDKNIHMNGAGTSYQAFLDLADAAEEKGGTIGDRTMRLVKAGPRAKFFDDAVEASIDKSRELQNRNRDGLAKLQELAIGLEARHWSAATSCVMQLNQAVA